VQTVRQGAGTAAQISSPHVEPAAMPPAGSPFQTLSPLAGHYAVEQPGRRIVIYNRDKTECIARISPSDDKGVAILSVFSWQTHGGDGSLNRIEAFLMANGFNKYNSWVQNDEKEYFLQQGFTVKESTVSANGCVVEKTIDQSNQKI
jgi:hypothetical protein